MVETVQFQEAWKELTVMTVMAMGCFLALPSYWLVPRPLPYTPSPTGPVVLLHDMIWPLLAIVYQHLTTWEQIFNWNKPTDPFWNTRDRMWVTSWLPLNGRIPESRIMVPLVVWELSWWSLVISLFFNSV